MEHDTQDDVGGIVHLEHINITVPDQLLASLFYAEGLGFTRDPKTRFGGTMWINVGDTQIHLPTQPKNSQQLCGHIGIVTPSLSELSSRLEKIKTRFQDTKFAFAPHSTPLSQFEYSYAVQPKTTSDSVDWIEVKCPWGELTIRFYERQIYFDKSGLPENKSLRLVYVEENCNPGTAERIVKFYKDKFNANGSVSTVGSRKMARIQVGGHQELLFREAETPVPEFQGHHICIYISDFSGTYKKFKDSDLLYKHNTFDDKYETLSEALTNHQFRICDFKNDDDEELLHRLEHEVRSLVHPYYMRPLVNREGNWGILV
eukprot:TRINITY_DN12354_c0_g1_i1.p1 TRINITY_DN12354_c0_g1~~TRINITY_DN12354_c0_g1_i1.p1  ORF type:complete len:316 (+),score=41.48 TRINITY_DN12354_c0_g1_i1:34-981(+)